MRHRKEGRKLNRTASHRKAMLANMAANLFIHKQIRTTHPKALEARRLVEALITKAKRGDLHARREVLKVIRQKEVVKILFDDIAPQYADRPGGYTRIIKLGQRKNDAASVSLLALVDWDPSGEFKATTKKTKAKAAPKKVAETAAVEAAPVAVAEEVLKTASVEAETAEVVEAEVVEDAVAEEAVVEEVAEETEATEAPAEAEVAEEPEEKKDEEPEAKS